MAELAAALISPLGGDRYEHDIALRRAALDRGPLALVEELVERPLPGGANLFSSSPHDLTPASQPICRDQEPELVRDVRWVE